MRSSFKLRWVFGVWVFGVLVCVSYALAASFVGASYFAITGNEFWLVFGLGNAILFWIVGFIISVKKIDPFLQEV